MQYIAVPSIMKVYISMQIMQQLSDVPRDERTLFVTFSNGYPLTKDELHDFFLRYVCHLRLYYIRKLTVCVLRMVWLLISGKIYARRAFQNPGDLM
jgi:hypothetical protein